MFHVKHSSRLFFLADSIKKSVYRKRICDVEVR